MCRCLFDGEILKLVLEDLIKGVLMFERYFVFLLFIILFFIFLFVGIKLNEMKKIEIIIN